MHYYSFNIGDYVSSTQHLEPMEDLAYRRMLDLYYSNEEPLPNDIDKIARLTRMRSHKECIAIVLEDFFTLEKDRYHNNGADKALALVYKKSEAARKSAEARWNKNKDLDKKCYDANALNPQCAEDAIGMLHDTQYTIHNTQSSIVPSKTKPSKLKFNDEDLRFSSEMFNRVLVTIPSAKKPNFDNWANTIRLMREVDNRTHNEMWNAFDWASKDSFWCSNILSPDKLRKQFDKLTVKINETSRPIIQQDKSDGRSSAQRAIDNARDKRDRERESMRSPVVTDGRLIHGQVDIEERSDSITTLAKVDWEPI